MFPAHINQSSETRMAEREGAFVENKTRNVYVRVVCSDSAAEAHYMQALTGSLFTHSGRCLTSSKVKVNHSLKRDDELGAALLMGDV